MSRNQFKNSLDENFTLGFEETIAFTRLSDSEDSGSDLFNQAYIESPPCEELNEKLDYCVPKLDQKRSQPGLQRTMLEIPPTETSNTIKDVTSKVIDQVFVDEDSGTRRVLSPLKSPNIPELQLPANWKRKKGTYLPPFPVFSAAVKHGHHTNMQNNTTEEESTICLINLPTSLSKHIISTNVIPIESADCNDCLDEKENKHDCNHFNDKFYSTEKNVDSENLKKQICKDMSGNVQKLSVNTFDPLCSSSPFIIKEEKTSDLFVKDTEFASCHKKLDINIGFLDTPVNEHENRDLFHTNKKNEAITCTQISNEKQHKDGFSSTDSDESSEYSECDLEVLRQLKFQQVISGRYTSNGSDKNHNSLTVPLNNIVQRGMGVKKHVYHDDLSTIYEVDSALTDPSSRQSKSSSSSKGSSNCSIQNDLGTKNFRENVSVSGEIHQKLSLADSIDFVVEEIGKCEINAYDSSESSTQSLISPKPSYSTPKSLLFPKTTAEVTKRKYLAPPFYYKSKNDCCDGVDIQDKPRGINNNAEESSKEFRVNPTITSIDSCNSNYQRSILQPHDVKKNLQSVLDDCVGINAPQASTNSVNDSNIKSSYFPSGSKSGGQGLKLIKAPEHLKIMPSWSTSSSSLDASYSNDTHEPLNFNSKSVEASAFEKGILEESDLTLVPASLMTINEETTQYNAAFDSPSLVSFLQHERKCMLGDSGQETSSSEKEFCKVQGKVKSKVAVQRKRDSLSSKCPRIKYKDRTKRLWNNLEEVKKKKSSEDRVIAASTNRVKAKEFSKNLTLKNIPR